MRFPAETCLSTLGVVLSTRVPRAGTMCWELGAGQGEQRWWDWEMWGAFTEDYFMAVPKMTQGRAGDYL